MKFRFLRALQVYPAIRLRNVRHNSCFGFAGLLCARILREGQDEREAAVSAPSTAVGQQLRAVRVRHGDAGMGFNAVVIEFTLTNQLH